MPYIHDSEFRHRVEIYSVLYGQLQKNRLFALHIDNDLECFMDKAVRYRDMFIDLLSIFGHEGSNSGVLLPLRSAQAQLLSNACTSACFTFKRFDEALQSGGITSNSEILTDMSALRAVSSAMLLPLLKLQYADAAIKAALLRLNRIEENRTEDETLEALIRTVQRMVLDALKEEDTGLGNLLSNIDNILRCKDLHVVARELKRGVERSAIVNITEFKNLIGECDNILPIEDTDNQECEKLWNIHASVFKEIQSLITSWGLPIPHFGAATEVTESEFLKLLPLALLVDTGRMLAVVDLHAGISRVDWRMMRHTVGGMLDSIILALQQHQSALTKELAARTEALRQHIIV